jgi:hypothetical protein
LHAQQVVSPTTVARSPFFLASSAVPDFAGSSSSSSSSDAVAEDGLSLRADALDSSQPPPRRRYGRPNYASSNSNPDGSSKWAFVGGVGLTMPVGDTHFWETPSWGFQVGGGRNWSKTFGVLAQFDYDHFGLQGATIANEDYIYNYCTTAEYSAGECLPQGPAPSGTSTPIDGSNHVWSFTLNPTFTVPTEGSLGAYVVVGGGFYHKVTNFTTPTTAEECYYFCEEVNVNQTFDHYTSNAPGVNAGFGLTYKMSKFSNERFYMEARYVLMLNSQKTGVTDANIASAPLTATNFYPANSNRTSYIPIKFGIRF